MNTSVRHAHLSGIFAAAVTPLKPDTSLDLDGIPILLNFLASRGCHGALMLGTTGEGPSFSRSEREKIMRCAVDHRKSLPGFRLLAGTGTPSLSETIDLTRLAFELGYDGVVVLPPYYFRKATEDGLFEWFSGLIHTAVPTDGNVLGYHFPGVAGIGFSIDLLKRLMDAFPTQFVGIKDSAHDAEFSITLGDKFGSDLSVFSGTDSDFQLALDHQAVGCITAPANLLSPGLREIYDAHQTGNDPGKIQEQVAQKRHLLENYMPFPPTLKALLHRLHNLPRWAVKPPLEGLDRETEAELMKEISVLKL